MLKFTTENSFAMDVRDFFDLESTLESSSKVISSAHDEQRLLGVDLGGDVLDDLLVLESLGDQRRQFLERLNNAVSSFHRRDSILSNLQCHERDGDDLTRVRLGRSDSDLGTAHKIDTAMGGSGDGATDSVGDTDAESVGGLAVLESLERIGGLSRL